MIILAIETSCDETGVAIVESTGLFEHEIKVNLLASQIKIHTPYGGVVPGLAAREHVKNLPLLVKKAIKTYGSRNFDAIAYTDHPGLEPALLVGRTFAKTFAYRLGIPAYPVNHLYGHLFANFISDKRQETRDKKNIFPAVGLVVSGGHTQLYKIRSPQQLELLGETIDDAVGEALDKGARLLGLPYPGGPKIEALAQKGRPGVFTFPSPMMKSGDFRFSFAGLKTSLLYKIRDLTTQKELDKQTKADLAVAFQKAAFDVVVEKTKNALLHTHGQVLLMGGGVAANHTLRERLQKTIHEDVRDIPLLVPPKDLCTDNGVMIALAYAIQKLAKS